MRPPPENPRRNLVCSGLRVFFPPPPFRNFTVEKLPPGDETKNARGPPAQAPETPPPTKFPPALGRASGVPQSANAPNDRRLRPPSGPTKRLKNGNQPEKKKKPIARPFPPPPSRPPVYKGRPPAPPPPPPPFPPLNSGTITLELLSPPPVVTLSVAARKYYFFNFLFSKTVFFVPSPFSFARRVLLDVAEGPPPPRAKQSLCGDVAPPFFFNEGLRPGFLARFVFPVGEAGASLGKNRPSGPKPTAPGWFFVRCGLGFLSLRKPSAPARPR